MFVVPFYRAGDKGLSFDRTGLNSGVLQILELGRTFRFIFPEQPTEAFVTHSFIHFIFRYGLSA